jgi:hypothetical protein
MGKIGKFCRTQRVSIHLANQNPERLEGKALAKV